jgi:hypothetical protein
MVFRLLQYASTLRWIPGPGPSHFVGINCAVLPPTVIMKYSVLSEWSCLASQNKMLINPSFAGFGVVM